MFFQRKHYGIIVLPLLQPLSVTADISVEASARVLNFDYEEFDTSGNSLDREVGVIPGFAIMLADRRDSLTNTLSLEIYDGTVDYDGHLQSGTPHNTETEESLYRLFYKLNWSPENNNNSIYTKISWQSWDRNVLPQNSVPGLFERYQWWTLEIGITAELYNKDANQWLFELGLGKIGNGTISIDLEDLGYGQPELAIDDGDVASTSLKYIHSLSANRSIGVSLSYQQWSFDRSETQSVSNGFVIIDITEPRSESKHTAISLDYRYLF